MNRERLIQQLSMDEGLRLKPYIDTVGKITIGIGRNLTDGGITATEALSLCNNDLDTVEAELNSRFPWWTTLSEERREVLANMCFNMGIGKLFGFQNMLTALKAGDYETAAAEMLNSGWASQVGDRAKRLATTMKG